MLNQKTFLKQPIQRTGIIILFILVFFAVIFRSSVMYKDLLQLIVYRFRNAVDYSDFCDQWRFCALTLRGVDPYTQIGTASPAIPEIGTIHPDWGTSPWGLISGNLFYFGFLNFRAARLAYLFVSIATLAALTVVLFLTIKKHSLPAAIAAVVLSVCSYSYLLSLYYENAGMICCSFVIIACLIVNKHPYLSGVLLGFAMVKPQVALPVCLVLLLTKQLKPLFTAAGLNVLFYAGACAFTKRGPVKLLTEFMQADIGGEYQYYGIFNFLYRLFSFDKYTMMYLSMAFCVMLLIPVILISKKYLREDPTYFIYFVPCVVTSFWSYSGACDGSILLLPCCVLLIDFFNAKKYLKMIVTGAFLIFIYFIQFFNTLTQRLLTVISSVIPQFSVLAQPDKWYERSVCDIALLAFAVIYFYCTIVRIKKDDPQKYINAADKEV